MATRPRAALRWFTARASIAFLEITRGLPLPASRWLTLWLVRLGARLMPRVRRVAAANLDLAYGGALSPAEKRRLTREAVDNMALVAAEFTRLTLLKDESFHEARIETIGIERLPRGSGAIVIGAHLGNWEWMAPALARFGFKVAEIVRPLDDPALNRYVDRTRCAGNIQTIPKDLAAGEALRLLKDGWLLGILIDQSPRVNAAPVRFFGQDCWGTIAPALLARRTGLPVFLVSMVRREDGRYRLEVHPEVPLEWTGNLRADLVRNSQCCQDAVEEMVRCDPGQWLWLHQRWKSRPRLEQEWAGRDLA